MEVKGEEKWRRGEGGGVNERREGEKEKREGEGGAGGIQNSNPAQQFCGAYVDMRHRISSPNFLIL